MQRAACAPVLHVLSCVALPTVGIVPALLWLLSVGLLSAARSLVGWRDWRWRSSYLVFMSVFIFFLMSGFNLEGNMDMECNEQLLSEDHENWVQAVEAEQRAIEELPFVKSVAFHYGNTANDCKVLATVWCCWRRAARLQEMGR